MTVKKLGFILLLVILLMLSSNALASFDKTADDAVNWVLGHSQGVGYEYDGYTGYYDDNGNWIYVGPQCVDLIRGYMDYISGTHTTGNGYNYASNWLPDGYTRYYKGSPQKGDILVWTTGSWGHVAIVTNVQSNGLVVYSEQNGALSLRVSHNSTMWPSSSDYWGIIRPDFKPSSCELDVNGWTDGKENGNVENFATFDVYIDGNLVADDVSDFCTSYGAGASYEIKDIKIASAKSFDGLSNYTRSGFVSGGRAGTLNANTDVRLTLHTVDAAAFVNNHTPSAVSVYNGHSYYFYNKPATWYGAKIVSEYLGGHLVTISNAAENSFVKSMIGDSACWIGATDQGSEGEWKWVSGESFSYSNWSDDQPDNYSGNDEGAENYAHIWANGSQWNDGSGYTQWPFICEIDRAYTVTYNSNGGSAVASQKKAVGQTINLSTTIPTRSGYTFLGWDTSAAATSPEYQPGSSYNQDEDVTLHAVWKSNTYTITYDPNGGTDAPPPQTVNGGSAVLSSAVPSRPHHRFMGWAVTSMAQAAAYQPGSAYTDGTDVTLYAVWERKLDNILVLPGALTEIEDEAFLQISADAVVIPAGVARIGNHAFDDIAIYGYANSEAESYANANGLTFIPITNDWVLDSQMPTGAHITAEKWTYTLTTAETITSTETSLNGWTQAGFTWEHTGDGVWLYAGFPEGFDTGHTLYAKHNKSALPKSKETSATTKREAGDAEQVSYIYWHWTFVDVVNDDNHNVLVEDARKLGVNIYGSVYRDFVYFDAFESATDYGTVGPGTNGMIDVSPLRYAWRGIDEDASQWWWRFEIYQQAYTDYQKLFTYVRDTSEMKESATPVVPGENITNVQHWVKYSFAK